MRLVQGSTGSPVGTIAAAFVLAVSLSNVSSAQRAIDGTGNHPHDLGAAGDLLNRMTSSDYGDGINAPAGSGRPSARAVSNAVVSQAAPIPNAKGLSDYFWLWGQFLDHDIDLTVGNSPQELMPIAVPWGDPHFDPYATGTEEIPFSRSFCEPGSPGKPREQINDITAFVDGSVVYGSDPVRAHFLRRNDGTGKLRMSAGDLMMFNTDGLFPNANEGPLPDSSLFLAGDVRANENTALAAMHTLFAREHNRIAEDLAAADPELSGDDLYEIARAWVGAEIQAITYNEFLPILLGGQLPAYEGYDVSVDPRIANEFSTAAYRFGHTMLSPTLMRLDENGEEAPEGHLELRHAFFDPTELITNGVDSILRGLAAQRAQEIDPYVIDDVRNFLFGPPGSGGFDLASLNIQRGRDHGLPGYNEVRAQLGLGAVADFDEITSDVVVQARLASVYDDVDQIDLWVGGLAEDPEGAGLLGETFTHIIRDQFLRLRDADAFWYELVYAGDELQTLRNLKLSAVIERNSGAEVQSDVFFVPEPDGSAVALAAIVAMAAHRRSRHSRGRAESRPIRSSRPARSSLGKRTR